MINDPVVEEVRAWRHAQAAKLGYDLQAICQEQLQAQLALQQQGWVFQSPANPPQWKLPAVQPYAA